MDNEQRTAQKPPVQLMKGMEMHLWVVAGIVFSLNLPFGYWRTNVEKYSRQWFLAIHLPVPAVIALRIFSGLGWHLITFPVLIGSFFAGQFLGGIWNAWLRKRGGQISSCLVLDVLKKAPLPRLHKDHTPR